MQTVDRLCEIVAPPLATLYVCLGRGQALWCVQHAGVQAMLPKRKQFDSVV